MRHRSTRKLYVKERDVFEESQALINLTGDFCRINAYRAGVPLLCMYLPLLAHIPFTNNVTPS